MTRRPPRAVLGALERSSFRSRFHLAEDDATRLADRDPAAMRRLARDIVERRLSPALPANDGRQTPYCGHPVFVAQHATATCCRRCLAKWHGVPLGSAMSADDIAHAVDVLCLWLEARRTRGRQLAFNLIEGGPANGKSLDMVRGASA